MQRTGLYHPYVHFRDPARIKAAALSGADAPCDGAPARACDPSLVRGGRTTPTPPTTACARAGRARPLSTR
ncbi:hypothetical protein GCM10010261_45010 [Streptomyces pilosus]|nr:hypothetical protein GCM10010261_45010 [Streptomyces pilosus]